MQDAKTIEGNQYTENETLVFLINRIAVTQSQHWRSWHCWRSNISRPTASPSKRVIQLAPSYSLETKHPDYRSQWESI
jgi:hypothetical protein